MIILNYWLLNSVYHHFFLFYILYSCLDLDKKKVSTLGKFKILPKKPDILECEVKWALGSITRNKASRGNGIPVELFQILKDDAVKVPH